MVEYDSRQHLPSGEDLLDSHDIVGDNELQNLVPNLLLGILALIWRDHTEWFFGANMGIYHHAQEPAIIPNGFLSLGVERFKGEQGRFSYVLWAENRILPLFALDVVPQSRQSLKIEEKYQQKKASYAELGILYYVVYHPSYREHDKIAPFAVYRLLAGEYVQQRGEPVWMPELGLAIGRGQGTYQGWTREWLYWYDKEGKKFPSPEEVRQQETERAMQALQRLESLASKLQAKGIDPDNL